MDRRTDTFREKFDCARAVLGAKSVGDIVSWKFRGSTSNYEYSELIHHFQHDAALDVAEVQGAFRGRAWLVTGEDGSKAILVEHETGLEIIGVVGSIASLIGIVPLRGSAWRMLRRRLRNSPHHRSDGHAGEIEVRQFRSRNILIERKVSSIEACIVSARLDENRELRKKVKELEQEVQNLKEATYGSGNQVTDKRKLKEPKSLRTWGMRSGFSYVGSIKSGTQISYGRGCTASVTREQYLALISHFRGMTVPGGTSRTNPPVNSVGEWLKANVTRTGIASYVCPILVDEGCAERVGKSNIAFLET